MPAVDHVLLLLGQRDVLLDTWLAHEAVIQE